MKKKHILLTGAAGFIGAHLYFHLSSRGHDVSPIDNYFAATNPTVKAKNVDVRSKEIHTLVQKSDIILHLAAQNSVDYSVIDPKLTFSINTEGTFNLLEACRKSKTPIIIASTSEVYGGRKRSGYDENSPLLPLSPYAASKAAADQLCSAYVRTYSHPIIIVRKFNIFGPFQRKGKYGALIPTVVDRVLRGLPIFIFGNGQQTRDYMSIRDALDAYESILKKGKWGEVYVAGTGTEISVLTVVRLVIKLAGKKVPIRYTEPRPGDMMGGHAQANKIARLGFRSQTDFERDLWSYIQWHKEQYTI